MQKSFQAQSQAHRLSLLSSGAQLQKREPQRKRLVPREALGQSDHSVNAATLQKPQTDSPTQQVPAAQHEQPKAAFNWYKQWYPLASVTDYDPKRPHAEMLFGKKLVLWCDGEGQWRCFEDECPHRLVPLSEGRLEGGNLMCGYHGWTFKGDGKLADVPQLWAKGTNMQAKVAGNARSCAKVRPTRVHQGLIFVWGESNPEAEDESAKTLLTDSTFRAETGEENVTNFINQYVRDLPANFEVWTENMQDQSHVAFAHHGVAGKRGGEKEGLFRMKKNEMNPSNAIEKDAAYHLAFEWSSNGKTSATTNIFFKPPCLTAFKTEGNKGSLYIYAVPISSSTTRLIINATSAKEKDGKMKPLDLVNRFLPDYSRALSHLFLNKVNQGDLIFMTGQHRALGRTSSQRSQTDKYFLATDADGGTATWNAWLKKQGGGGPVFADPGFTENFWWAPNGHLKREQVLDNWSQHTSKCTSCQKVLSDVEKGQKWSKAAVAVSFLTLAGLLGQSHAPWDLPSLATLVVMGASAFAYSKLTAIQKRFHYEPWSQPDLDD